MTYSTLFDAPRPAIHMVLQVNLPADSTRRQIGGLFDLEDLGLQPLAGFGERQRPGGC